MNFLVISKNGASGDYPGCTDLAYQNAISFGADVIDCPVQMSKDGIPFCLGSINLYRSTTIAQLSYSNRSQIIPQIEAGSGIFTFSLTWSEIQNLTRKFKLVGFYFFAFPVFCCTPLPLKHGFFICPLGKSLAYEQTNMWRGIIQSSHSAKIERSVLDHKVKKK